MDTADKIREPVLRELIRTAIPISAVIKGTKRGFSVVARFGDRDTTLETARGDVRIFASLDTAALFVQELGLQRFEIDMTDHQPGRLRKARPDRAEALRRTRTRMRQETLGI